MDNNNMMNNGFDSQPMYSQPTYSQPQPQKNTNVKAILALVFGIRYSFNFNLLLLRCGFYYPGYCGYCNGSIGKERKYGTVPRHGNCRSGLLRYWYSVRRCILDSVLYRNLC